MQLGNESSQNTIIRLFLLSILAILSQVFSNMLEMGLEGLQQHLYIIKKFHTILLYPVSNERAHHGWVFIYGGKFFILRFSDGHKMQSWECWQ